MLQRGRKRKAWECGAVALAAWLLACAQARPDVIELRGGGEIQGKVIADPAKPETVQVLLLKGKNPLTFQSKQILKVIPKASPLDEYLRRKQQMSATAPAEHEMGLWCERNGLPDLARAHFEAAITQDRAYEPARKKLGHIQIGDQWFSADELRQMQGMVKYKGRWMTEEARAKIEETAHLTANQATWARRIKMLRQAIVTGPDDRRREAEAELMRIHESEAVHPLVKVLGSDLAPIRTMLAHVLGAISAKEAARGLADMLLAEPENDVRIVILDELKAKDDPGAVPYFVKALRTGNVKVVNRAAWALGNLDAVAAVPHLVAVLLTSEDRMIMVPETQGASYTAGLGPGPALMAMAPTALAYLSPPTVGPGVVAYGAFVTPYYGPDQLLGGGGGMLGVVPPPSRSPSPRVVTYTYENVEVLAALVKLTGQDFGYNTGAWRRWINTSFNPNPMPVRQIPQP